MNFKEKEKIINEFRLYYNKKIHPELLLLERKRKRLNWFFALSILLLFFVGYLAYATHVPAFTLFLWIPIGGYASFVTYQIQQFRKSFKPSIVNLILTFIDDKIEEGNNRRLLEMEQRIQAFNLEIKELRRDISETKQKLYYKIEQRIEDIARQIEGGVEQEIIDIVRERVGALETELFDLKEKINHAKLNPDKDSTARIADMESEVIIVEKKLSNLKLTLEEGLEEQITAKEAQIKVLEGRIIMLRKRMSERLQAGLEYNYTDKIPQRVFNASGIFSMQPAIYRGEDYIRGYVGSANFEMSELEVLKASPVRARYENIFRGIFFKANFFYDTGGLIVFLPKEERQFLSDTIKHITSRGGKRLHFPDEAFEEVFLAYATHEVNAESLLSFAAFQAIMDYKKRSGKQIYVSFTQGYVYIAITETKDILEPKILKSNANYKLVREFFEDLLLIISIVEDFDLNH